MSANAKAFFADLATAKASQFDRVSGVRRGDSDGEVSFKYHNDLLEGPLEIQVLATGKHSTPQTATPFFEADPRVDITSYPVESKFMVFTASDNCDANIVDYLERISASTKGCRLQDAIQAVSTKLTARVDDAQPDSDTFEDQGLGADDGDFDCDIDGFEPIEAVNDEYYGFTEMTSTDLVYTTTIQRNIGELKRMHSGLKAAQSAGLTVTVFTAETSTSVEIASLSIRVSKLGLPSAVLSAWGLEMTDYLVLLIRFSGPYPDPETLLATSSRFSQVQYRFGRCKVSQPSGKCARLAFDSELSLPEGPKTRSSQAQPEHTFHSIYMSNTINVLLNEHFAKLLKLRRKLNCTWDAAQVRLSEQERCHLSKTEVTSQLPSEIESFDICQDPPISKQAPLELQVDHAMEEEDKLSFPLVAMQFALHRLCKCTEFCMVCHKRLESEFESLKPYVCSNALCLYQYLSLGLGPSLEHEVINSPYVVDLLISFFYGGLKLDKLREIPRGLALKAPVIGVSNSMLRIECCLKSNLFEIPRNTESQHATQSMFRLHEGDWVLVMIRIMGEFQKVTCRVNNQVEANVYSFEMINVAVNPIDVLDADRIIMLPNDVPGGREEWYPACLIPYTCDPDDMSLAQQKSALRHLLDCTPSVLAMRTYLMESSRRKLLCWNRLNRSAISLVRWIVASNTSYFVQEGAVPAATEEGRATPPAVDDGSVAARTIEGLDDHWMQFRFARGSPEKENTFSNEVQKMCINNCAPQKEYPTLFAWHGSPIGNWHSIIRTGLDFSSHAHGRSYGNGVYFSSQMAVSMAFAGSTLASAASRGTQRYDCWPLSDLRVSSAISICEIVNRPDLFVSTSPHFVVDKIEWIQCRYLLLKVNPTVAALKNPLFASTCPSSASYMNQDPGAVIMGMNGQPLKIPSGATRIVQQQEEHTKSAYASPTGGEIHDYEQDGSEKGDDLDVLIEGLEDTNSGTRRRKRQRSPSLSGHDSIPGSPLSSATDAGQCTKSNEDPLFIPAKPKDEPCFRPGTLDLSSLPQLPNPGWAVSSRSALKTLNREIKELFKTQEQTEAAALGWYVDIPKVSNLFQWIVELHTFDAELPLAKDMVKRSCTSIVLEVRFGSEFPMSPPFVRIIRPRFLSYIQGGGGHVTAGGAICSEMLTNSGWSPAMTMEKVFLQVRLGLCDTDRPARLDMSPSGSNDYGIGEAVDAYQRAARAHGWSIPEDLKHINTAWREI
ncbi:hypothetical protein QQS21_005757 [Conoideocrella luteorostrata]|uniref:UBC core domain-containing protein n=1 Tax=Conoideocrella luteorostrata TaxID=1105319 RepID=A0AAJ0CT59_9HYPO|nr:hypothetical protein QQS21_005757 [Conoideocrella luteorostrata]